MFDRNNPVEVIRKGDLDKLKKMLEKDRDLINRWDKWPDGRSKKSTSSGNMLHMAAFFNQPEIINFLVKEKGMDVNQPNRVSGRTPLHHACEYGGFESASLLFSELGADPTLRCDRGTPYDICKDELTKVLLWPSYKAQMHQEEAERQTREAQWLIQERAEAAARVVGTWEINPSTSEIVHKHELPGGEFRVMDAFNFAVGRFISITEKLNNGNLSHKESFFKPDEVADNPTLSEAFAKLQELSGKNDSASIVQQNKKTDTGGRLRLRTNVQS